MSRRGGLWILVAVLWWPSAAAAQSWTFDARKIGMGNVGGTENLGSRMIDEQREYRSIVLPFGLIQVLRDLEVFKPAPENSTSSRASSTSPRRCTT
jgi:hypothetical protein